MTFYVLAAGLRYFIAVVVTSSTSRSKSASSHSAQTFFRRRATSARSASLTLSGDVPAGTPKGGVLMGSHISPGVRKRKKYPPAHDQNNSSVRLESFSSGAAGRMHSATSTAGLFTSLLTR